MTTLIVIALTALPALYLVQYSALFLHELGHFIVAKAQGQRVHHVYLGEGPELFHFTFAKTQFHFFLLPISGSTVAAHKDEALFSVPLEGGGIYITYVHEDLHKLGLHAGDIVLAIDDCIITDSAHFFELSSQMSEREIHCRIRRGDNELSVPLYYPNVPTEEELENFLQERDKMENDWLLTFGGPLGNLAGVALGITLALSASASVAPLWYLFAFINATYFAISLMPIPNSDGSILMEQLFPAKTVKHLDPRFAFKLQYFINGAMFGYTVVSLYRAANGV